jgi:hypothetical protein
MERYGNLAPTGVRAPIRPAPSESLSDVAVPSACNLVRVHYTSLCFVWKSSLSIESHTKPIL